VGVLMATALMVCFTALCKGVPAAMVGVFSRDPQVQAVGVEYLRIVSWNYVPSGIVFVSSSMFQAMGNTLPSLVSSSIRILLVALPTWILSHIPGFQLRWIWNLSVAAVFVQMACNVFLLRREYQRRLTFASPPLAVAQA
jgi:Na+-driven multidrug efflux pump